MTSKAWSFHLQMSEETYVIHKLQPNQIFYFGDCDPVSTVYIKAYIFSGNFRSLGKVLLLVYVPNLLEWERFPHNWSFVMGFLL